MNRPSFSVGYAGARRWRPPRVELRFDVAVHNESAESRWAILPTGLPRDLRSSATVSVREIDVYELTGDGRVVVLHFMGEQSFFALLVPGSSELRLEGVPISYWGETPPSVELEVAMVETLLVDGRPAGESFEVDPSSEAGARVDAGALANQAAVVAFARAPEDGALLAEWTGARVERLRVELDPAHP